MPQDDKTPVGYSLPHPTPFERWIKVPLRHVLYPAYLKSINPFLRKRYEPLGNLGVDQWYWGYRGLEYPRRRAKLQSLYGINGKAVLIAGCGTGRDVPSWVNYRPSCILGVDYFNYRHAWDTLIRAYGSKVPISFAQGDLRRLESIVDESFDIVGSDEVLEHVQNLPEALKQFYRILKPGGVVYATFGPLWYTWGGDHISGYDSIASGYNHLVLEQETYKRYLDGAGEFSHSEDDGRTWIEHGLFSYLRPREYLTLLSKAGFEKIYLGVAVSPSAVRCLRENLQLRARLTAENGEFDLIVTAMMIIYRKPGVSP